MENLCRPYKHFVWKICSRRWGSGKREVACVQRTKLKATNNEGPRPVGCFLVEGEMHNLRLSSDFLNTILCLSVSPGGLPLFILEG